MYRANAQNSERDSAAAAAEKLRNQRRAGSVHDLRGAPSMIRSDHAKPDTRFTWQGKGRSETKCSAPRMVM